MSILNRLKKIEQNNPKNCFCGKTSIDWMSGEPSFSALTYCPNCKEKFDLWAHLSAEAQNGENLTDFVGGK